MAEHKDLLSPQLHVGPTIKRNQTDSGTPIVDATGTARKNVNYIGTDGVSVAITDDSSGDVSNITISAPGSTTDEKAKISSNDTTPGYLNGKLVAGTNITLVENNDGGNETLTVNSTASGTFTVHKDGTLDSDNNVGDHATPVTGAVFALGRVSIAAGTNITVTVYKGSGTPANNIYDVTITHRGGNGQYIHLEDVAGNNFPKVGNTFTIDNEDSVTRIVHFKVLCD